MGQEIRVIIRVSNKEHAETIRKDIIEVLKLRTPIAHIGEVRSSEKTIEPSYKKANDKRVKVLRR